MQPASLGNSGLAVTPIGFGSFKIGRNQKAKYAQAYDLPDESGVQRLLNAVLDLGINYIATAPAYGASEERIGRHLAHRRHEFILSTKVGETFEDGRSRYDFSAAAVRASVHESLRRLRTDVVDIVFIHADGNDRQIVAETDCPQTLWMLKEQGLIRAVGLSAKTTQGALAALPWADVLMVEYHLLDRSQEPVIAQAASRGVGVVVKKGLACGALPAVEATSFVLANSGVGSLVIGGLRTDHIRSNVAAAEKIRAGIPDNRCPVGQEPQSAD